MSQKVLMSIMNGQKKPVVSVKMPPRPGAANVPSEADVCIRPCTRGRSSGLEMVASAA